MALAEASNHTRTIRSVSAWSSVCLGLCLASKESTRFSAVWYLNAKDIETLTAITLFCLAALAAIAALIYMRKLSLRTSFAVLIGLAVFQTAGLIVRALPYTGLDIPSWINMLAEVGIDSTLVSLVLFSGLLISDTRQGAIRTVSLSIIVAGFIQVIFCFIPAVAARVLVCALPCMALIAWLVPILFQQTDKRSRTDWVQLYGDALPGNENQPRLDKTQRRYNWLLSCIYLFFICIFLMCIYANWHPTQDGALMSLLIQLASGTGLLLGGIAFMIAQRIIQGEEAFQTCRDIIFLILLISVYLSTLSAESGMLLSVLLFALAYAPILAVIWLQPFYISTNLPILIWICIGFAIYKTGWYIGILVSATLGIFWLATALNVLCVIVLIAIIIVQHILRRHTARLVTEQIVPERDVFALALDEIQKTYGLTAREMDVFILLAHGRTSLHIQRALNISDGTARTHISHIYKKLGVNSQQTLLDIVDEVMDRI